ncbi:hypothetical protein GCM10023196_099930 [Actinoallomurus vinaceus]|uniref:Uncharacterized protein n=1 Tax=Actinoallomurus vinaceus TaxID=1080074 RepID=A0ABP8UVP2_9ACTN
MLETVARDSPVLRAISAWVGVPAARTAWITRRWFASRSDDCDPGVADEPGLAMESPRVFKK